MGLLTQRYLIDTRDSAGRNRQPAKKAIDSFGSIAIPTPFSICIDLLQVPGLHGKFPIASPSSIQVTIDP